MFPRRAPRESPRSLPLACADGYGCLSSRDLLRYDALRGTFVVFGRLAAVRGRHANMVSRKGIPPDKAEEARIRSVGAIRVAPRGGQCIVILRLRPYAGRHADIIRRIDFTPDVGRYAGVGTVHG